MIPKSDTITGRIYTHSGFSSQPLAPLRVLHLGCGGHKISGAVGIDMLELPGIDIVHNLDSTPWPLSTNSFDVVVAHAVLEHLGPFLSIMEEIHRVTVPGGRVIICVPYFRSIDAYTDPTHKHFFTASSMDYLLSEEKGLAEYRYTKRTFRRVGFWYGWPQYSANPLTRWFKKFIQTHPRFYDQFLSLLFPMRILVWELEVEK